MTLWSTRQASLKALDGPLRNEAGVLDDGLAILDEAVTRLEGAAVQSPFTRAAAVVLVKGKHLALACYSLALDGLAQEGGAVFRPLIEAVELLTYLRLDPQRADQASTGTLPRAGEIAKAIEGPFRRLRDYLNTYASHFSFSWDSLRHIVDLQDGKLRKGQVYREPVLRTNLAVLASILIILGIEANNCLYVQELGSADDLADRLELLRTRAHEVFKGIVPEPPPSGPHAAV
jgi:hypothetical protein